MNNEINVYPNIQRILKIVKFTYTILEIKLFESVRIAVYLYSDQDVLIESKQYIIEGDEYNGWSNDDRYIINLLKQKIQEGI